ncbi:MarR family winged helix-turn-helix transcriptional regulator [Sphingobium sp. CR2-8]|uniref:MarR family winged helix-turn-helix transcriptional regulator n=1 Tax=Sphingobium sp. CR2-8 TaxID=1306534 RepID=UPI002DBB15AC|nr:MarR family winged helix-turn-helix transcriptional regulator [Sphingobium sp. CR2-8]MEC3909226.1 MarR family winged helix-turn-helix transcriptional regulator [Sphingobium sp. CR2-8]
MGIGTTLVTKGGSRCINTHMETKRLIPYLEEVRYQPHICLAEGVRSANRALSKIYGEYLDGCQVSAAQASILMRLYYLRETTMLQLAKHMETDRTTMARNVDLMQRLGFVEVIEGKDRRSRIVRMTDAGFAALQEALPKWLEAQAALRTVLGDAMWTNILAETRILASLGGQDCDRSAR